jgi:hypothetical protein
MENFNMKFMNKELKSYAWAIAKGITEAGFVFE